MKNRDKINKIILVAIPNTVCNLRCRYCYLTKKDGFMYGKNIKMQYSPEHVGKAFSKERLGGPCFFNFCASGETLLVKDIDKYIYETVKNGHYVEIVTNLTVTSVLDKILQFEPELLARIEFKCSFHYLQLKERGWLDLFANNVKKIWKNNCSANIEITPDDELIPYIEEVKEFSMQHFGALPHLTIARDDKNERDYLTSLSIDEYDKTWQQFDSSFWKFKKSIFNVRRNEYCYAGKWSLHVDLSSGATGQCYCNRYSQNIFKNVNKPIDFVAIGKCQDYHCYNGHALMTLGLIPNLTDIGYGDIRDRIKEDGSHWIQEQMRDFLNSKLIESNLESTEKDKAKDERKIQKKMKNNFIIKCLRKIKRILKLNKKHKV